ncbi:MAG: response regulator transcription factor [Lentisphaeria bacterium]
MAEKQKILVVDDERDIQELVSYNLIKNGYLVTTVASGEEAITRARSDQPDLIVLDLMLPGVDGLDVCKILKNDSMTSQIPIIMLTAKDDEVDVVTGLEVGADDYITKPFSPRVLVARVRTLFRKRQHSEEKEAEEDTETESIKRGNLVVDPGRHEVTLNGKPVELTFSEFRTLQYLAKRPGWVFSRGQIIDAVHGDDYPVTERSVDVQIVGLRKKLGKFGDHIETVRGIGYRFRE